MSGRLDSIEQTQPNQENPLVKKFFHYPAQATQWAFERPNSYL